MPTQLHKLDDQVSEKRGTEISTRNKDLKTKDSQDQGPQEVLQSQQKQCHQPVIPLAPLPRLPSEQILPSLHVGQPQGHLKGKTDHGYKVNLAASQSLRKESCLFHSLPVQDSSMTVPATAQIQRTGGITRQ
ncbi:hypothetical protein KIL84_009023 [Mauremys mutica]|uniref:Uncharacterized protein n=1 Tax=Mauremys mutica TaxID=74926 RepID=A0A9D3XHS7_9SAUR|nr:hypothetical protein KIL84_009023 [Mauremys mutica]